MTATTLRAGASRLTLDERGRLVFRLDGRRTWSGGALCVVHYYDRQHPRAQRMPVPWDHEQALGTPSLSAFSAIDLRRIDARTASATVTLKAAGIRLALRLEMAAGGDGFDLAVAADGVGESSPGLYRLLGVEILPGLGAARTGEQGYLTLPNWYGCQTFFDRAYPREVWQTIYSSGDQWENVCNAPVFGITRAQGTLCGLVAEGDADAQLVCRRHWEAEQANGVHPFLVWRWAQEDGPVPGPRRVRYRFAHPDDPSGEGYAFVGRQYRQFLRASRGVRPWAAKAAERPEAADFAGRFLLKLFMGYKEPHPEGRGAYHATCTCDEAGEILRQCRARGMEKLTAVLVGWGQEGHDGKCPTYLPADDRVGGEARMKALIAWCRAHDILLGVHTCHNASYRCSDEFDEDDLVRHRSGEYWAGLVWSGGQSHRVCPRVSLDTFVRRDLAALARLGFHGHHHFDAVGSFMPCHSPRHPVTRAEHLDLVREEFRVALGHMGSVSTEMPFGPYFGVVDGFFHSYSQPFAHLRAGALGRYFLDRSVPMLGVALHGSHRCGEAVGRGDQRLRMLELLDLGLAPQGEVGMRPSPVFGIPSYAECAGALEEAYRLAYGPGGYAARLGLLDIEGRWEPAPGVSRTRYGDGTTVLVNRGDEDAEDVPARSFRFLA